MNNLFELFHSDISLGESLIYAVIGYMMVFLMLLLLIIVIKIMAAVIGKTAEKEKAVAETPKAESPNMEKPEIAKAPGTGGELTLINVSDRDAAMIMAIVADAIGKPINELRFRSIREVKKDE
jgi:Na+-transporting methylmalonyl-CoA/oxaloacetate decarboxylase gamma subunit